MLSEIALQSGIVLIYFRSKRHQKLDLRGLGLSFRVPTVRGLKPVGVTRGRNAEFITNNAISQHLHHFHPHISFEHIVLVLAG